jgi:hypothetical protein
MARIPHSLFYVAFHIAGSHADIAHDQFFPLPQGAKENCHSQKRAGKAQKDREQN